MNTNVDENEDAKLTRFMERSKAIFGDGDGDGVIEYPQQLQHHLSYRMIEKKTCSRELCLQYMQSTRIILLEIVHGLIEDFIEFKLHYGCEIEKRYYGDNAVFSSYYSRTAAFISSLFRKRVPVFMNSCDEFELRDGTTGTGGWLSVGTDDETTPLLLNHVGAFPW